jgi:hypothetical protein
MFIGAPALDAPVAKKSTNMVSSSCQLDDRQATIGVCSAKIDKGQAVTHLAWADSDVGGRTKAKAAIKIVTPTLDLKHNKQASPHTKHDECAEGSCHLPFWQ